LLKEQLKNGLRASSKANLHEWHSALGAAMLCIWWDMEGIVHYELFERNLTVTAESY
jgi:hypothetical protein